MLYRLLHGRIRRFEGKVLRTYTAPAVIELIDADAVRFAAIIDRENPVQSAGDFLATGTADATTPTTTAAASTSAVVDPARADTPGELLAFDIRGGDISAAAAVKRVRELTTLSDIELVRAAERAHRNRASVHDAIDVREGELFDGGAAVQPLPTNDTPSTPSDSGGA